MTWLTFVLIVAFIVLVWAPLSDRLAYRQADREIRELETRERDEDRRHRLRRQLEQQYLEALRR